MRNGKYAVYKGIEYSAGINKEGKVILRSQNIEDTRNGFVRYDGYNKNIKFIKYVDRSEVGEIYKICTKAVYKGYEFEVIDEKDGLISIVTMVGDYRVWLGLGMKCIDRGVYQKWIHKEDALIKIEKKNL